jgi:heat shock protein HslJ
VKAINGHATPASGDFHLAFEARSFSAQMGCNRAGGDYRIDGHTLRPGMVAMTQMACESATEIAIPLMTYESWGMAVLSQPMRLTWQGDARLTLSNAAGSIELERIR